MKLLVVAALLLVATPARADDWEVRVDESAEVDTGASATVSLTIAGLGGRVVSKDGPVRVALASQTLKTPRVRYDRRHAADPAADAPRFDLKFTAAEAGDHQLGLDIRFWLCGKRSCRPVHVRRTVKVHAR